MYYSKYILTFFPIIFSFQTLSNTLKISHHHYQLRVIFQQKDVTVNRQSINPLLITNNVLEETFSGIIWEVVQKRRKKFK